jgi:hypothetical protein
LAYFFLVGTAFSAGLALGGTVGSLSVRSLGALLTTTATHAVVAPGLLVHATGRAGGDPGSASFEVAMTYLIVAGVMNVLLAFDAWDVAGERKP